MKANLQDLRKQLPPIIARTHIEKLLGGVITRGYIAVLDSQGLGPKRFKIGGKVAYKTEDLLAWLEEKSQVVQ